MTDIDDLQSDRISNLKKDCCCIKYLSLCCFGKSGRSHSSISSAFTVKFRFRLPQNALFEAIMVEDEDKDCCKESDSDSGSESNDEDSDDDDMLG